MIIFKILHTNKNNTQVNFNGNLEEKHPMLSFIEEVKDTAEFFKRNCESIETFFVLLFFFEHVKITSEKWYWSNFKSFIKCG